MSYCSKLNFSSWYLVQVNQEGMLLFSSTHWMKRCFFICLIYNFYIVLYSYSIVFRTVLLPTFFKIYTLVFNRRKKGIRLVQTITPNPILCISGWNWITDSPNSVSQHCLQHWCCLTTWQHVAIMLDYISYYEAVAGMQEAGMCDYITCCHLSWSQRTQRSAITSCILSFSSWLALCNNTSLFLQRYLACFPQKPLKCKCFAWRDNIKKLR